MKVSVIRINETRTKSNKPLKFVDLEIQEGSTTQVQKGWSVLQTDRGPWVRPPASSFPDKKTGKVRWSNDIQWDPVSMKVIESAVLTALKSNHTERPTLLPPHSFNDDGPQDTGEFHSSQSGQDEPHDV